MFNTTANDGYTTDRQRQVAERARKINKAVQALADTIIETKPFDLFFEVDGQRYRILAPSVYTNPTTGARVVDGMVSRAS